MSTANIDTGARLSKGRREANHRSRFFSPGEPALAQPCLRFEHPDKGRGAPSTGGVLLAALP